MDETRDQQIMARLNELDTKLDRVLAFTDTLQRLAAAWTSGGKGKLLTALARVKTGPDR